MFVAPTTLTSANAHLVLEQGLAAIASGQTGFDFSQIVQADSAAIATMLAWLRAAQARRADLTFHHLPASIQSLAALYDVADLLRLGMADHIHAHTSHH